MVVVVVVVVVVVLLLIVNVCCLLKVIVHLKGINKLKIRGCNQPTITDATRRRLLLGIH